MKVKNLLKQLQAIDPELEIVLGTYRGEFAAQVGTVEVETIFKETIEQSALLISSKEYGHDEYEILP